MYKRVTQLKINLDIIKAQQGNTKPQQKYQGCGQRKGEIIMKKSIVFVSETEAQVTKAFQKQAYIFGTEEFKLWREYLVIFPDAKMTTKSIKKNPDRKTNRNLTYKNMEKFLCTLPDAENLVKQFKVIKTRSCTQNYPYRFVLEWFEEKVSGYESYGSFVDEAEKERRAAEVMQLPKAANA
jgi:hypothetical protein